MKSERRRCGISLPGRERRLHGRPVQRRRRCSERRHAAAASTDREPDAVPAAARPRPAQARGKALCTVLDFVGNHRREFRFDRRFRALLGGIAREVERQVERGFPFLPAGCHMELDPVAQDIVLRSIRQAIPSTGAQDATSCGRSATSRLASISKRPASNSRTSTPTIAAGPSCVEPAGLAPSAAGPTRRASAGGRTAAARRRSRAARRAYQSLVGWTLRQTPKSLTDRERRSCAHADRLADDPEASRRSLTTVLRALGASAGSRELLEFLDLLPDRVDHVQLPLDPDPERSAGTCTHGTRGPRSWRRSTSGVASSRPPGSPAFGGTQRAQTDLFAFTLDKSCGGLLSDDAISRLRDQP